MKLSAADEPVPISALEHYSYCARQCAIIHVEQTFEDNVFTERGHLAHRKPEQAGQSEGTVRFGLRIWSDRHGIVGVADGVDFRAVGPYPIEYKVGASREWPHEAYQLCAQALCLEEMFGCTVGEGAIYYRGSRLRRRVELDQALRAMTIQLIADVRKLLHEERLPPPVNDRRCRNCSLFMACLPAPVAETRRFAQLRSQLYRR